MARDLKFCTLEVEGLYYPYSENNGADQLRSKSAPLFSHLQKFGFQSHNEAQMKVTVYSKKLMSMMYIFYIINHLNFIKWLFYLSLLQRSKIL